MYCLRMNMIYLFQCSFHWPGLCLKDCRQPSNWGRYSHRRKKIKAKSIWFILRWCCCKPACQCRRPKRCRFYLWVGKIPWRRAWQPTVVFLPGEFHGQRRLVGYGPWCCKEWTWLSNWTCTSSLTNTFAFPSPPRSWKVPFHSLLLWVLLYLIYLINHVVFVSNLNFHQ